MTFCLSLSVFFFFSRMVRSGCPVLLLHLFSIFAQTGGMTVTLIYPVIWNLLKSHSISSSFNVENSPFNEFVCFTLLLASTQDILYPYGPGHRDLETPKMDDGSSPEVILLIHFVFFNIPYRSIYVSLDQNYFTLVIAKKVNN